jgi:hypothetical protein
LEQGSLWWILATTVFGVELNNHSISYGRYSPDTHRAAPDDIKSTFFHQRFSQYPITVPTTLYAQFLSDTAYTVDVII